MAGQYTPGPWRLADNDQAIIVAEALDADGNCEVIADVLTRTGGARPEDFCNAAHIVRCVNSHDELLEALKAIVDFCDDPDGSEKGETLALGIARLLPAARAAIAKAEGR